MTFLQILQDVYDRTGNNQTQSGTAVARVMKRYVNRWHQKVLTSPGMERLRYLQLTQASVADQAAYAIPLQSIRYITEATNDLRLIEQSIGWYRDLVPDPTAWTGTPEYWVPLGNSPVSVQPSNASEIFVKSTAAGDTGTCYIEAIRTGGYPVSLSVTMTGVTAVSLGAAYTDIIAITDFYLSAVAVGTVTLHEDSGAGTELARIAIGQSRQRYLKYALVPTPSEVITYTLDGIAPLVDLVNDFDEPLVPADFHDILVDGAVYEEWVNKGRTKEAQALRTEIELRIRRLRASLWTYDEAGPSRGRSFEETISLPLT